ncbi:MAG: MMPL family transporter [Pseudomonadota bacterium]
MSNNQDSALARFGHNAAEGVVALRWPVLILVLVALVAAAVLAPRFRFDASADTLVARSDPDLRYYQALTKRFGDEEFIFLIYSPDDGELLSQTSLDRLRVLQNEIANTPGVRSVFSVLDAPLLKSPPMSLIDLLNGFRTLASDDVDLALAAEELRTSPIFSDLLVSADGKSTALRIDLETDIELAALYDARERLRDDRDAGRAVDPTVLRAAEVAYDEARATFLVARDALLRDLRKLRDRYRGDATVHLGGVPMVAADMIDYVKRDIAVFGVAVLALVMAMLFLFFRQFVWVWVPLVVAGAAILATVGILALIRQAATVVSSNFMALLAILAISFSIHLIVRYRELALLSPGATHLGLVSSALSSKVAPLFYTALTTIVAFASLASSDILPVIHFGWIMVLGVALAFVMSCTLFPAIVAVAGQSAQSGQLRQKPPRVTAWFAGMATRRSGAVLLAALGVTLITVFGISRLSLDNRFIDYFRSDSEVRQGLVYIDKYLGGTVPFDVVVKFAPFENSFDEDDDFADDDSAGDDFADDDFAEDGDAGDAFPERYWFTPDKLAKLNDLHSRLEAIPQIGKVLSLASLERVGREFNDGEPLSSLLIVGVLGALPADIRGLLIDPYANPSTGEMRLSARMVESGPSFSKDELIAAIAREAEAAGFSTDETRTTGMMVLFNNMLKQLFESQTSTIGYVIGLTFCMFALLLWSIRLAVLGLLPNILGASVVLGVMGLVGIPLDMMTITIAAISVGIGVDNAIHYLHRFRTELAIDGNVKAAVERSHASIGRALYFASFTIIAGFSVLAFSSFVPTIYFGLLTALAMALATLANLLVLPSLLVRFVR